MQITDVHMRALMRPTGVVIVGATSRDGSVGKSILENVVAGQWCSSEYVGSQPLPKAAGGPGRSTEHPNLPYRVYPVNPTRDNLMGFKCFPKVAAIEPKDGCEADLAIICVPAKACPDVLKSCGELGTVRAAVVIAAGFKEVGPEGLALELECVRIAKEANIAIIGPNCLGVQAPNFRLNASFSAACANPGHIAFISQSGAICTAVLDWSLSANSAKPDAAAPPSHIGFSAFVSLGSMSHVEWAEWIEFCGNDADTDAIVMYMETIGDADKFFHVAQKVSRVKPIIVIKAGKTEEASAAAVSHTGSLTGTYDNFLAAMDRAGCLVVDTIDDLQNTIEFLSAVSFRKRLSKTQSTSGISGISENVVIITNAGGPGVLCTDAVSGAGLKMVNPIPDACIKTMNEFLPAAWSHANPVDILGDADDKLYEKSIKCVLDTYKPSEVTVLVILSPQSVTKPTETAEGIANIMKSSKEPPFVICSWMGGEGVEKGRALLRKEFVPVFKQPDVAARTLGLIARQRRLAQGSQPMDKISPNEQARKALEDLKKNAVGDVVTLSEHDSKAILELYGIEVSKSVKCLKVDEVEAACKKAGGFPVVLKVHGGKFTHKSDIGGVMLNLKTTEEAKAAFTKIEQNYKKLDPEGFEGVTVQPMISKSDGSPEMILGSVIDPQFGPMVMFGTGGTYVEIFKDTATTLAPVCPAQASELVRKTKISKAILGDEEPADQSSGSCAPTAASAPTEEAPMRSKRFASVDPSLVYQSVTKYSRLCVDLKDQIVECEMNPMVITNDNRLLALDARIVVKKSS